MEEFNVLKIIKNMPITKEDYSKLYDYYLQYTDIF